MPPVESAIAMSDGVPSRPASAMTTPATETLVPTGRCRASAMGVAMTGGGVGEAAGVGVGAVLGLGAGVAVGAGVGDGVWSGVGVGDGATEISPTSVAWSRYPASPVPLLSR
jgi:hypothetical protein